MARIKINTEAAEKVIEERRQKVFMKNYKHGKETINDMFERIANASVDFSIKNLPSEMPHPVVTGMYNVIRNSIKTAMLENKIVPAGRILRTLGVDKELGLPYNCYACPSSEDSLSSIYDVKKIIVSMLQKQGGVGTVIALRPKGDPIKRSGGHSAGPIPFMEGFSQDVGSIQIGGNRRGALLMGMYVHHPEIRSFINAKRDTTRINNANISVFIDEAFEIAVQNDTTYDLHWDGKVYETVRARELWDEIIKANHDCGEPGVIFIDRMRKTNNTEYFQKIDSVNACFSGDTLIQTVEGAKTFRELKELSDSGNPINVLTRQDCGAYVYKQMHSVRITGYEETYKVEFECEGVRDFIDVTENHSVYSRFKVFDETKFKIKDLLDKDLSEGYDIEIMKSSPETYYTDTPCKIISIKKNDEIIPVYNGTVSLTHRYFVKLPNIRGWLLVDNCSEQVLPAHYKEDGEMVIGSCNLTSLNLYKIREESKDYNDFIDNELPHYIKMAVRLQDGVIYWAEERLNTLISIEEDPLIEKVFRGIRDTQNEARRIGLGIMGLASLFIKEKIRYGSDESCEMTEEIFKTMLLNAYYESSMIAKDFKPFPGFILEEFKKTRTYKIIEGLQFESKYRELALKTLKSIEEYGLAHSQILNVAPTGNTSVFAGVSSSAEPIFDILGYRRNDSVGQDDLFDVSVIDWAKTKDTSKELEVPDYFVGAMDLKPEEQLSVLRSILKYIESNVSKTINASKETTFEETKRVFNLILNDPIIKSATFYRDGTRNNVISSSRKKSRPDFCEGITFKKRFNGNSFFITINSETSDGLPFEILTTCRKDSRLSESLVSLSVIMHHALKNMPDTESILNMCDQLSDIRDSSGGVDEITGKTYSSLSGVMADTIREYLVNKGLVERIGEKCPNCGKYTYVRDGKCNQCKSCFFSTCSL